MKASSSSITTIITLRRTEALFTQKLHDRKVRPSGGAGLDGAARCAGSGLKGDALFEEEAQCTLVAVGRCDVAWSCKPAVRSFDITAFVDQESDRRFVSTVASQVEDRLSSVGDGIDITTVIETV